MPVWNEKVSVELATLAEDMQLNLCYEYLDGSSEFACGRMLQLAELKNCDNIWLPIFQREKEVGQVWI